MTKKSSLSSISQFQATLQRAVAAGQQAAQKQLEQLNAARPNSDMIDESGSATIVLTADGRSAWGRFIKSLVTTPLPEATICFSSYLHCHILMLNGLTTGREASVATAAQEAAWSILQQEYGIEGYVDSRSP